MPIERIRAVIFDLDGTLADTIPVCFAAFRITLREYVGRDYSDDEIEGLFGPNEEGVFRKLLGDVWKPAFDRYLAEYEAHHDLCTSAFPGVIPMLDWLHERDIRIAIVTGKGAESAAISLRRVGLASHFDRVEAGGAQGAVKPEAIKQILADWGIAAENAVYVGDAPYDVRAARTAGVAAISVVWASTARREKIEAEHPDELFETIRDFRNWLDAHV